jgi:NAD(P)-dependent dehydrogenase (short-subunit alcohol dehydrogenase family)
VQDATSYAKHKIRINALCPGYTDTPLLKDAKEGLVSGGEIGKVPMGRFGHVDEIADCAVFMASPMASFMTGSRYVRVFLVNSNHETL